MRRAEAGEEITYLVTYLEMTARPSYPRPHAPLGPPLALIHAEAPPVWYFLDLYEAVGRDYEWTDRHHEDPERLAAFVGDPRVMLFTLMRRGWPAGFFMLDTRKAGLCDLAYFGLVPEAIGQGLGLYLVETAVHTGWDTPGVERMTVETNSLDHPRALPLYQRAGFTPRAQEEKTRVLTRARDIPFEG